MLDVLEHEARALEALGDERLTVVLETMLPLQAEIVSALASLEPPTNGAGFP